MTEEKFVDDYMAKWKNMLDQDGHIIPFDRDEAVAMLKQHPKLFETMLKVMSLGNH